MEYRPYSCMIQGIELYYLKGGNGPTVLYLHGMRGEDGELAFLSRLAEKRTVYVPCHPGFGRTVSDERVDSVHDLAFFYLEFMDRLELDRTTLIGSCLGGWIALDLGVLAPHRIEKMVLLNSVGIRAEGVNIPDLFKMSELQLLEASYVNPQRIRETIEELATNSEKRRAYQQCRLTTAHLAWNPYFHDPKLKNRLHRLTSPTLVVWGKEDRLFPVEYGRELLRMIPHSEMVIIEQTGYYPHQERPEDVSAIIDSFLVRKG